MKIKVYNRQRSFRLDRRKLAMLGRFFARQARLTSAGRGPGTINLVFVGDLLISRINRRVLGHEGTTDVITMPLASIPGESGEDGAGAEILVNVEQAWRQGRRLARSSPSRELALYVAHGIDHLSGWDDDTPAAARRMRRRELRWLDKTCTGNLLLPV